MGKWSRRAFIGAGLAAGGALVVGVAIRTGKPDEKIRRLVAGGEGETLVNTFVKINKDNTVTAVVPHAEMGQGVHSTLAQMLADELDADWSAIQVIEAPAEAEYASKDIGREFAAPELEVPAFLEPTVDGAFLALIGMMVGQVTGGSFSVRGTGQRTMRTAGAAAREMLVGAAAQEWGVPASEIAVENGVMSHAASGKEARFGEFAELAAEQPLPVKPKLKSPEQFKLMGKPIPRKDIPAKVDGTAVFGIDAELPGQQLTYAAVKAPPIVGSKVARIDAAAAEAMPGVLHVLNMTDFVAVVAEGYWQAQQALNQVQIEYTSTDADTLDQAAIFARYDAALNEAGKSGGDEEVSVGDANEAFDSAAQEITAEYKAPFLAHATMEPQNCTAWVRDGECDIRFGSQFPNMARKHAAELLDIPLEKVNYQNTYLGGGFGRRAQTDSLEMAVRVSQEIKRPVKLIWSREEDTMQDWYRPSSTSRFEAGLDENGKLVAWNNVHTHLYDPPEAAHVPYYDIPNQLVRKVDVPMHLRFGAWRSVDHSHNSWFIEGFLDEVAEAAGKDPVELRRELLKNSPRHLAVLNKAAEMANWGEELPEGVGRGIAIAPSFGSVVAHVAEVDMSSGKPRVTRVWCCADIGYAMNPDSAAAQMESSIIYGLTAALYGEITVKDGAVEQSNFHDYRMVRMNDAPEIEVAFINSNSERLGGAGEPGLPPLAPAVTNAIYAASGTRVRELPTSKQFG